MTKTEKELGGQYVRNGLRTITKHINYQSLYVAIHGDRPTRQQLQRFRNRFAEGRGNPGCDMLGLIAQHVPELRDMTLGEFLGVQGQQKED